MNDRPTTMLGTPHALGDGRYLWPVFEVDNGLPGRTLRYEINGDPVAFQWADAVYPRYA